MTDVMDNIQSRMAVLDEIQEQVLLASARRVTCESARKCRCGNDIPEKRRLALPGVTNCVDCQVVQEKQQKTMEGTLARRVIYCDELE